jgi:hypothetical protein
MQNYFLPLSRQEKSDSRRFAVMIMKIYLTYLIVPLALLLSTGCNSSESQEYLHVPLQVVHANDLHIKVSIGGQDLLFLVDTGASITAVDSRILNTLDLPPPCSTQSIVRFRDVERKEDHFHNILVALSGHSFNFTRFQSADFSRVMPTVNDPLRAAVGVLGADFLLETGAIIDFKKKELRIPIPLVSNITHGEQGDREVREKAGEIE